MKRVVLDFKDVSIQYELHLLLKSAFGFPDYYGMNLDALHDCLTDISEETEVELVNADLLKERLGRKGELTLRVLRECAAENGRIKIL